MITENKPKAIYKIEFVLSMLIFGAIGIVRKNINLPSSVVAFFRGVFGALFLLVILLITRERADKSALKKNALWLILSGSLIGINWVVFFESYNYTSVATTTLCYYMAPVFVIIVSPFLFKEKLSLQKIICVVVAFVGMVFVSGVIETGISNVKELTGVLLALLAAVLYAIIVLINKKICGIPPLVKTSIQLVCGGVCTLPYVFLTENVGALVFDTTSLIWLAVCCLVSTGLAYVLYFSSMEKLKAQTVSIMSYLDPFVAVLLSAFVLKEKMNVLGAIGCVLILGATIISEIDFKQISEKRNKNAN